MQLLLLENLCYNEKTTTKEAFMSFDGFFYIAPPKTAALNPFTIADETLFEILQTTDLTAKNLQQAFQGLGRDTAQELSHQLEVADQKLKTFRAFFNQTIHPNLTEKAFSAVTFSDSKESFESLSLLMDYYFQEKAQRDRINQQASDLIHRALFLIMP